MPITISVVLPAFNEAANIEATITSVVAYLERQQIKHEVIVVNDGSRDATAEIVTGLIDRYAQLQIINHSHNLGYGSTLRTGFDNALMDYIFIMDSDRQFDINDLDQFLVVLETNNPEILIGYRHRRADPWVRSLNAWAYHQFIWLLFGLKSRDIDCAFKLFQRHAYLQVKPIQANGALFSAELLIKWQQLRLKTIEIPVRHFPRQFGTQTGANLRVIFRMFWECWQLKKQLEKHLNPIKAVDTIGHEPHPLIKTIQ